MDARKWIEHESGLLIPRRVEQSPGVAQQGQSRRSRIDLVMTFTALVSVAISIGSLAIATKALWTQNESFADQLSSRESANASRVTWWKENSGALRVQNASPVRIENVYLKHLRKDGTSQFIDLPDLNPCTIASILPDDEVLTSLGPRDETQFSLSFFDRVAAWSRPPYGDVRLAVNDDFPSWHLHVPADTKTRTTDKLEGCTIGD